MKTKPPTLHSEDFPRVVFSCNLARADEYECPLLIVVLMTPINQIAAFDLLQENKVETVPFAHMFEFFVYFREIDRTDQRVKGFDAQKCIILMDCVKVQNCSHITFC